MASEDQTAEDFLKIADKFKLGCLLTEQQNPKTIGLSDFAKNDVQKAISIIKDLDIELVQILKTKIPELENLYKEVNDTVQTGGRIFICGCGATGRLAVVLQTLWRQQTRVLHNQWNDRVISFMAGGDAALIKSIQDFQDHPQFAEQQVVDLGFKENDLMIGSTEGGQTSWVIGSVWKSTQLTKRKPYILYGNTDEILIKNVERSRKFIESDKINKINCNVGYMALAGSTRMQSTTILMYAIGLTLLGCDKLREKRNQKGDWRAYAQNNVSTFQKYINTTDFGPLAKLIEYEASLYQKGEILSYRTNQYYALSILTDTTQRSPTFSLTPFNNKHNPNDKDSWCNLIILHEKQPSQNLSYEERAQFDWKQMLGRRQIRGLNTPFWQKYKNQVTNQAICGFGLHEQRQYKVTIQKPFCFTISKGKQTLLKVQFPEYPSSCKISHHSILKVLLNTLSTIVMGKMNRYYSNIMTYVKPTNYKLIDRASRYVLFLRPQTKYEEAVHAIYKFKGSLKPDQPIVQKVIQYLNNQSK